MTIFLANFQPIQVRTVNPSKIFMKYERISYFIFDHCGGTTDQNFRNVKLHGLTWFRYFRFNYSNRLKNLILVAICENSIVGKYGGLQATTFSTPYRYFHSPKHVNTPYDTSFHLSFMCNNDPSIPLRASIVLWLALYSLSRYYTDISLKSLTYMKYLSLFHLPRKISLLCTSSWSKFVIHGLTM